ncbi:MAG TPA: 2OG-Fe(II) oxygenase family protein [Paracoccaceae bacterium]|nr:2OG-Fe(II) oxygenase family protein [Paracoccaceae bacterium]
MAGETPHPPQILQLWPTQFMSLQLPGNQAANPILSQLLLAEDKARADLTGDYLAGNLLEADHPVFAWLKQCFERAIADYARAAGITVDLNWTLQAWANVNLKGDYHNLHNHPHSWLSGTYYVAVPEQPEAAHRSDLNPGAISFFDPRPQANMTAIVGDGQFDPEFRLQPKAGDLFLWPAFLHHLVHPNMADDPRLSISFNVVLKWRDAYVGM